VDLKNKFQDTGKITGFLSNQTIFFFALIHVTQLRDKRCWLRHDLNDVCLRSVNLITVSNMYLEMTSVSNVLFGDNIMSITVVVITIITCTTVTAAFIFTLVASFFLFNFFFPFFFSFSFFIFLSFSFFLLLHVVFEVGVF
jgi:hypothetical protein